MGRANSVVTALGANILGTFMTHWHRPHAYPNKAFSWSPGEWSTVSQDSCIACFHCCPVRLHFFPWQNPSHHSHCLIFPTGSLVCSVGDDDPSVFSVLDSLPFERSRVPARNGRQTLRQHHFSNHSNCSLAVVAVAFDAFGTEESSLACWSVGPVAAGCCKKLSLVCENLKFFYSTVFTSPRQQQSTCPLRHWPDVQKGAWPKS